MTYKSITWLTNTHTNTNTESAIISINLVLTILQMCVEVLLLLLYIYCICFEVLYRVFAGNFSLIFNCFIEYLITSESYWLGLDKHMTLCIFFYWSSIIFVLDDDSSYIQRTVKFHTHLDKTTSESETEIKAG